MKKGFTLIELIVVIAILAVLAAIMIPNMMGFLGTARQGAVEASSKVVFQAARAYSTQQQVNMSAIQETSLNLLSATPNVHEQAIKELAGKFPEGTSVCTLYITDSNVYEVTMEINGVSGTYKYR